MYIQLKLYHCAFYQHNNCYINSYLDEESAPTLVPIIKGLNRNGMVRMERLETKQMQIVA